MRAQLFAFFPNANEKLGKKEIDRYLLQMRQEEVKRAILVLRQQPTSFASQVIRFCRSSFLWCMLVCNLK